jgi:hypothetical protein
VSRAEPDRAMTNFFGALSREMVIGAEFLDRPPRANFEDIGPARLSRQRRARVQALALMLGSSMVSIAVIYAAWTALRGLF